MTAPLGIDQETFDREMAEWRDNRDAKRAAMIGEHNDPRKFLMCCILTTQEEAAMRAYEQGAPGVVYVEGPFDCPKCSAELAMAATWAPKGLKPKAARRAIWFGGDRGWVCEVCTSDLSTEPDWIPENHKQRLDG